MNDPVVRPAEPADEPGTLFPLAILSILVGVASGLIGALFRLALDHANGWRNAFLIWAHGWSIAGLILVIAVCAVATGLAAWLVRRWSPLASGSGIPHVECVLNDLLPPVPFRLIPVKFIGGVLAIGSDRNRTFLPMASAALMANASASIRKGIEYGLCSVIAERT